jgi:hypothetical protein
VQTVTRVGFAPTQPGRLLYRQRDSLMSSRVIKNEWVGLDTDYTGSSLVADWLCSNSVFYQFRYRNTSFRVAIRQAHRAGFEPALSVLETERLDQAYSPMCIGRRHRGRTCYLSLPKRVCNQLHLTPDLRTR